MTKFDKCIKEYYPNHIKEIEWVNKSSKNVRFHIPSINKTVTMVSSDNKIYIYERSLSLDLSGFRYVGMYEQEVIK